MKTAGGLPPRYGSSREKTGDGTLYTTIYDSKNGLIYAYYFHDFSKCLTFNLEEELAKGAHQMSFASLFAGNKAYGRFTGYKTPQNSNAIFGFLVLILPILFLNFRIFSRYSWSSFPRLLFS
jgi:hypothetical protein